ncbi:hypothetical protein COV05_02820 [Candidatus Uhrbacteria bacterium CG10_big_fil_rev_8_21_14_0_10_48_16]|uniref:Lipid/polyisoprenoid-binding YceI-like domain-containing protein n=1 Tax=Candidatus Uhrbacteria bacterium CG10_big_fil_rev_8_21_14_0_10_48_16 TaxID=1975038 RepID=A0A2M8LH69_9BACT|nr:MAG: hypothetical protein COV05_02820 [Candidatus Uhrbacteria bacterium CG10_big_fil_rev_8_21_14_0_10_48_16]
MFKQLFPVLLIPMLLVGAGCTAVQEVEEEPQEAPVVEEEVSEGVEEDEIENGSYILDTDSESVAWEASKRVGATHYGIIQAQAGALIVENGAIVGGSVVVDMTTLVDLDLNDPQMNETLVTHLKSDDFFAVATFPTATYAISEVISVEGVEGVTHRVKGTMTIKGIDQEVEFPALIEWKEEGIRVTGTVTLDRTLWDVRFGSDKFFDNLGDGLIEDEFTLTLSMMFDAVE